MSLAPAEKLAPASVPAPAPAGGVHFAAAPRHKQLGAELRARRYLVAPVAACERGRLRRAIDDAVEGALAMRGALPPAVEVGAPLEPTLRDQVFRARALGAIGLALTLPRLADAPGGVLDVEDGVTLSLWLAAARRAPLLVVLDEHDRGARILAPVAIGELAGPSPFPSDSTPPPSGEIETRPAEAAPEPPLPPPPVLTMPRRGVMRKRSLRQEPVAEATPEAPIAEAPIAEAPPAHAITQEAPLVEIPAAALPEAPPPRRDAVALARAAAALMPAAPALDMSITPEPPAAEPAEEPELPPAPSPDRTARRVVDAAELRQHAMELDRARGPKPVSVIERLFGSRYMPLLGAVSKGDADAAVRGVVDAWRQSFEHSYREAFAALRVTGKRPAMVFDAPDIAARIARLNGARATKLLLVDAMRYDIGERVEGRLKERLAGRAVCVERALLWSALPTTTPTQLALLARGPEGLRDAEPESSPEPEIVRGRAVSTVRRDRVGSREVMKLDLVEARLRHPGPSYDDRIDSLAEEVTPILVKYVETLPPRTLVFLFGDHGFRFPVSADGKATGPATQGGTSPEEVLVPAQAWLVGGVH